jgi:hypothetical protein
MQRCSMHVPRRRRDLEHIAMQCGTSTNGRSAACPKSAAIGLPRASAYQVFLESRIDTLVWVGTTAFLVAGHANGLFALITRRSRVQKVSRGAFGYRAFTCWDHSTSACAVVPKGRVWSADTRLTLDQSDIMTD